MKYKEGDIVQTRFFHKNFTVNKSEPVKAVIQQILDKEYGVVFLGTFQHKWIKKKTFDRLSQKFDPGSGTAKKFKFLT